MESIDITIPEHLQLEVLGGVPGAAIVSYLSGHGLHPSMTAGETEHGTTYFVLSFDRAEDVEATLALPTRFSVFRGDDPDRPSRDLRACSSFCDPFGPQEPAALLLGAEEEEDDDLPEWAGDNGDDSSAPVFGELEEDGDKPRFRWLLWASLAAVGGGALYCATQLWKKKE